MPTMHHVVQFLPRFRGGEEGASRTRSLRASTFVLLSTSGLHLVAPMTDLGDKKSCQRQNYRPTLTTAMPVIQLHSPTHVDQTLTHPPSPAIQLPLVHHFPSRPNQLLSPTIEPRRTDMRNAPRIRQHSGGGELHS